MPVQQRLEQLHIFLMEQIIKRYRQIALQALRENDAGITVDQWIVLKQISENNGTSQVEIANSTVKDAPTTTRIIDQLTRKGLIAKQLDPEDRRRYMVFITEKGQALIRRLWPIVQDYRQIPVQNFSEEELDILHRLLKKIYINLGD
jgi:DNA-binding MarR family transcriptional regulator